MAKLNSLALYAALVFTINGLSSFLRTFIFSLVGERVLVDIRSDSFKCFIQNQISFHDKFHSGELISRLGNDICNKILDKKGLNVGKLRLIIYFVFFVVVFSHRKGCSKWKYVIDSAKHYRLHWECDNVVLDIEESLHCDCYYDPSVFVFFKCIW